MLLLFVSYVFICLYDSLCMVWACMHQNSKGWFKFLTKGVLSETESIMVYICFANKLNTGGPIFQHSAFWSHSSAVSVSKMAKAAKAARVTSPKSLLLSLCTSILKASGFTVAVAMERPKVSQRCRAPLEPVRRRRQLRSLSRTT